MEGNILGLIQELLALAKRDLGITTSRHLCLQSNSFLAVLGLTFGPFLVLNHLQLIKGQRSRVPLKIRKFKTYKQFRSSQDLLIHSGWLAYGKLHLLPRFSFLAGEIKFFSNISCSRVSFSIPQYRLHPSIFYFQTSRVEYEFPITSSDHLIPNGVSKSWFV